MVAMFCPNCGKDCGDGKFCSECGTQLQQSTKTDTQQTQWKVGMACPHCGGTKLEGNCCAFCGSQLMLDEKKEENEDVSYCIPVGKYGGGISGGGQIEFANNLLVVRTYGFFKTYESRIPYSQITQVVYIRPGMCEGYLVIRWEGNKDLPLPAEGNHKQDRTSVRFTAEYDELFYSFFYMLKTLAPATAKFSIDLPHNEINQMPGGVDRTVLENYYEQFQPHRNLAITALSKEFAISEQQAKKLVDILFDERQSAIYEVTASAVMKDVNLIVDRRNREYEEKMQRYDEKITRSKY